jgi:hypothetical protein
VKAEQIRKLLAKSPFRPFVIHLVNNVAVPVKHTDYAQFQMDNRTLWVEADDGSATIIDTALVQAINIGPPRQG